VSLIEQDEDKALQQRVAAYEKHGVEKMFGNTCGEYLKGKDRDVLYNDHTDTRMYIFRDLAVLELEGNGDVFITAGKHRLTSYKRAINDALAAVHLEHRIVSVTSSFQWNLKKPDGSTVKFVDGMKL